ncbi:hypothetical protein GCM10025879_09000 [Leuconostoc litchii]|nr:hypothetical protein GCM10025879_09000 [Leuconostoc litchii]
MTEMYDIAIIGGGPIGMFTAFYAGLRDTKAVLVESLATLGGQVTSLYPEKNTGCCGICWCKGVGIN